MNNSVPRSGTASAKPAYSLAEESKDNNKPIVKGFALPWLAARDAPILLALAGLAIYFAIAVIALTSPDLRANILIIGFFVIAPALWLMCEFAVRAVVKDASGIIFGVYGVGDEKKAYDLLFDYLFRRKAPIVIFKRGYIDEKSLDSPLLRMGFRGPGYIRVDPWTAILIQSAGSLSVECAGQYFLDKTDQVRGYVDLSLQRGSFMLENVNTKDNIPLKIYITLYYRIVQDSSHLRRHLKRVPREDAVKLAVMTTTDWKEQTRATATAKIRDAIAQFNFDDIHKSYPHLLIDELAVAKAPEAQNVDLPRIELQKKLAEMVDKSIRQWGTEVVAITLDEVTVPDEVKKTLREAWAAAWRHKVRFEEAEIDARIEKREAEGKRDAAEINRTSQMIQAVGEAESKNIITRAEADRERILAEAKAEAQRVKGTIQTELSVEFVQRMNQAIQDSGLASDGTALKEYFAMLRVMFPDKETGRRKTKGERDEKEDGDEDEKSENAK